MWRIIELDDGTPWLTDGVNEGINPNTAVSTNNAADAVLAWIETADYMQPFRRYAEVDELRRALGCTSPEEPDAHQGDTCPIHEKELVF